MKQKKWYRPINILWGIAVVLLSSFIIRNAINLATYTPQIREAEAQASSLSSELDEIRAQIAQREEDLTRLEAEIETLPTPEPTPTPTPNTDDYDAAVTYEQIRRNPQDYMGKKVAFLGKVTYEGESPRRWQETDLSRYFMLWIDGEADQCIDVRYSDNGGRVIIDDVVIAYGIITEDNEGNAGLIADSIYFPTESEIQDWLITRAFGDSEEADELRDALGTWQKGLDEVMGELGG